MPRVIPVLDILRGQAVHARGGRREDYRPVRSILRRGSDPIDLATAFRDDLGLDEVYVADLDAIAGSGPSFSIYRDLAALGLVTWIDAGLRDGHAVPELLDAGVGRIVVALETVAGPEALVEILRTATPRRVAFSLDLRDGTPLVPDGIDWGSDDPSSIARTVIGMGVRTVILLDLARVGSGRGIGTEELLRDLSLTYPSIEWIVGGGVARLGDLEILGGIGASAVLLGSGLHTGLIGVGHRIPMRGA
jgi:phosphoribosylformimino-5-aminoimidazole carboxamide ribotide isomerase